MKKTAGSRKGRKIRFEVSADLGSEVFLAGTFNGWDTTANALKYNAKKAVYETTLTLASGRHEYKFVVNGMWCMDPACSESVANDFGSRNSVVQV